MSLQRFIKKTFTETNSRQYFIMSDVLALVTIISILSIVLETVKGLSAYHQIFVFIEWATAIIFTVEYVCRVYIAKPKRSYVLSWFGVIDLIAFIPTYLGLGNLTFLKSARAIRIMRLLRMMRLAKVTRKGVTDDENLHLLRFNILIYFVALLFALLVSGTAMYLIEPQNPAFQDIPAGMWWSLKVFLGSIVVDEPVTELGQIFHVVTRFTGLLLLGLLVGVVGNVFRVLLMGGQK